MRAIKLSAILLMLAFVMICFVAVPVFSGDTDGHPWDADDTDPKDDLDIDDPINTDTTITEVFGNNSISDEPEGVIFFEDVLSHVVFFIVNTIYNYQPETYYIISTSDGNSSEQMATQSQ